MELNPEKERKNGFGLIGVFWIIVLLSLIALGYATTARMRARAQLNYTTTNKDDLLLLSALEKGRHEYLKYVTNRNILFKKEEIEAETGKKLTLWYPRFEPYIINIGKLRIAVSLISEAGRFDVNTVQTALLDRILTVCGVTDEDNRKGIIDSLSDWTDPDDAHHFLGAENQYYLALPGGYYCKNNKIESLEELLLIKGITHEIYYGSDDHPGLVDFLSVYGKEDKIDINSASPRAFFIIEGLDREVIQDIVRYRDEKPVQKLSDLSELVPQEYFSLLSHYFTITRARYMMIGAQKILKNKELGRMVKVVLELK